MKKKRFFGEIKGNLKSCTKCYQFLPFDDFDKRASFKFGLHSWCKICRGKVNSKSAKKLYQKWDSLDEEGKLNSISRNSYLVSHYGITLEEYSKMLEDCGGVCYICNQPETSINRHGDTKPLHIDHDHKTGKIRGLLCSSCNKGLGFFKDNEELLKAAIEYLRVNS